ncbi:MAG TPA: hypothetical protein VK463_02990 [Desulfomonilaceae bacterium]|nr:hypothetical protein [Desulfomonilaceae bacterium]
MGAVSDSTGKATRIREKFDPSTNEPAQIVMPSMIKSELTPLPVDRACVADGVA